MKIKIIISSLAFLILSGCTYGTYYIQSGSKEMPKTKASSILVYSNDLEKEYQVIGSVAAYAGNMIEAQDILKEKAAEAGADAVIFLKISNWNSYNPTYNLSGVMVKLK